MTIVRIGQDFSRWDELLALILSSFRYMTGKIDPPSSALQLTPESLAEKARTEIAFVAVDGEDLVGCIFLKPEPDCLYIGKLAVSPDAQGKGIGKRLLVIGEDVAKTLELPSLRLETRVELTANHVVFSHWGFVKTAENAHPGFDRTTSIEMRKVLVG
jgi:predicted N-acetyltransferase YhbS